MNRFVMVKQLEIQVPEPNQECNNKNEKKRSFKSKKMFDFLGKPSGLLHAAPLTL
jgi:hypothetical protein